MAPSESAVSAIFITNHAAKDLPETLLAEVTWFGAGSMKVIMTEGAQVYSTDLKRKDVAALVKNAATDWPETFRGLMLKPGSDRTKEVVAVAHSDHMTVIVRERGEVPLKICSFEVPTSETAEVSLYDWTVKAAQALEQERTTHLDLEKKVKEDGAALEKTKDQLQDLKDSSQAHEKELMKRFCLLLNTKKDKIRELQGRPSSRGTGSSRISNVSKKPRHKSPVSEAEDEEEVVAMSSREDSPAAHAMNDDDDEDQDENHDNDDDAQSGGNDNINADEEEEAQSSAGSSIEEDHAKDTEDEDEEL